MVAEVSGVPEETFAEVCRLVTESGNDTLDAYVEAFSTEKGFWANTRDPADLPAGPHREGRGGDLGCRPFIMQADGKAWLFAPAELVDGPLPAHYEPRESPLENLLYGQQRNPVPVAASRARTCWFRRDADHGPGHLG